jgi:DNA-binding response OmpR family regulator
MILQYFMGKKKKVLIVEDDGVLRSALEDKFTGEGFEVFGVGDAKDVLSLIAQNAPDVIVLDLILPLRDGISILEDIRGEGHTLPVLILSNLLGSESLRADAERLDAKFFNKSSTSLDAIVQSVKEIVV